MKAWTDAEIAKMNKLADQGLKLHQVAERLGRSLKAIEMKRFHTGTSQARPQRRIPAEYRHWYDKLRRCHSTAFARAELARILEQAQHEDAARVSP